MKAVFLMDPIEHLNPKKDTSLALMLEAQNQGFTCYYLSPKSISIKNHSVLFSVQKVQLSDLNKKKFYRQFVWRLFSLLVDLKKG